MSTGPWKVLVARAGLGALAAHLLAPALGCGNADYGSAADNLCSCGPGYVCAPDSEECEIEPKPPRLIAPISTTLSTSRQPTFRWELGADATSAMIELCSDRGCEHVVATLTGTTAGVPPVALPAGPIFWRGFGTRGFVVGRTPSPTWVANLPRASTSATDTSWGHVPDFEGKGRAQVVTTAQLYSDGHPIRIFYFRTYSGSGTVHAGPPAVSTQKFAKGLHSGADLNGDGYADLVVVSEWNSTKSYRPFLQLARGGPSGLEALEVIEFADTPNIYGVEAAGDVNGDGYGDVLVSVSSASYTSFAVRILFGSATGLSPTSFVDLPVTNAGAVQVADYNGDGRADFALITQGQWNNKVEIYYGKVPEGSDVPFEGKPQVLLPPSPTSDFAKAARKGDVNGDGYADLLVVEGYDVHKFHLYLGGPSGLPADPQQTVTSGSGRVRWLASLSDVNGDGRGDLVWMRGVGYFGDNPSLDVHLGGEAGVAATASHSIPWGSSALVSLGTILGDVDGDGIADLLIGGETAAEILRGRSGGFDTFYSYGVKPSIYIPLWDGFGNRAAGSE
jgi:hypothetical protein